MDIQTTLQCLVMLMGAVVFLAAFAASLRTMRLTAPEGTSPVLPAAPLRASLLGLIFVLMMILWRFVALRGVGMYTHMDSFLLLSLLLMTMLFYFRRTQHLRSIALFLLPMIAALLGLGAVMTLTSDRRFDYRSSWAELHILVVVVGSACFALGCLGGMLYLMADRQLKMKAGTHPERWMGLPPLASMERFNQLMVAMGFPLLTVACLMGFLHVKDWNPGMIVKTALALSAWAVYAILLNIRRTPAFRGRRAAWLNILGFAMLLAAFAAVNGMPRGGS